MDPECGSDLRLFIIRCKDGVDHIVVAKDGDEAEDLAIEDPDQAAVDLIEVSHEQADKLMIRNGAGVGRSALAILLETHISQVIASTEE